MTLFLDVYRWFAIAINVCSIVTCRPIVSGASIIYCIYVISVAIAYVTLIKNYLLTYLEQVNSYCAESDDGPLALAFLSLRFFSASQILFCFKLGGTFVDEATPLCSILSSLFPGLSWNIEILKRGFKVSM